MGSILKIENLSCKNILKNISLDLNNKEIYSLIGCNGSGKTTLLKCIYGICEYTGNINYTDISICLFDDFFMFDDVKSNLYYPLKNTGITYEDSKNKISKLLNKFDNYNLIYKNINELSYDEKKIIKFIQAIILENKLILFDNLFEGLSNKNINIIINIIKSLKKSTILYTTSNTNMVKYSNKSIVIKNGKISYIGDSNALLYDIDILNKNNLNIPFYIDLSNKLKLYNLIDNIYLDENELIGELWK